MGNYRRPQPEWQLVQDNRNVPESLKSHKMHWVVPYGWDVHLIDGLYVHCTKDENGHIIFQRSPKTTNFEIQFQLSPYVNKILGFDENSIFKWHSNYYERIKAPKLPNLNIKSIQSLWVMCDIVEKMPIGHNLQLPLLRVMPAIHTEVATSVERTHHEFAHVQFSLVNTSNIKTIRIYTWEDLEGNILDIRGDVYARLEFRQNVE